MAILLCVFIFPPPEFAIFCLFIISYEHYVIYFMRSHKGPLIKSQKLLWQRQYFDDGLYSLHVFLLLFRSKLLLLFDKHETARQLST